MKVITNNKKAYHDYFILDKYECGIVLTGTEIKSIRKSGITLKESYIRISNKMEVFIINSNIALYENGNQFNHEPTRQRKLLLHKKEILKISQEIKEQGYTLVPTKAYFEKSKVKIEIALAKGKKNYDKREVSKEKDTKRYIEKALKNY